MTASTLIKGTVVCLIAAFSLSLFAQNYTISSGNKSGAGFTYETTPFPGGIKVTDLDKSKLTMDVKGPALIQVWSTCCGGEPELWDYLKGLRSVYEPKGLNFVSLNFENGASGARQRMMVKKFFESQTKPEVLYLDNLGDAVDKLKVAGFPTYILVNGEGQIIFKTNGKDAEGVAVMEEELAKLLE
ncbi:TlpA family protein disulfide reductase [Acanthopleuribacter pedis]|uniref:Uncharacterized protein n=1 Tax=Acanthopleuribacter pedis TaxID=442870 RepID=A0A8J7U325_9BACT|nr:hypothetical protein [Acanthopleuribacter pedis]MBO1319187.1 hypothetical protein [Acanthopleuribacter pedis]